MRRYHVRCPVCGTHIPLFGDEPVEAFNVVDCHTCGANVDYRPEDMIPEGKKAPQPPPFPPSPSRNGRPHYTPPKWRY